MSRAKRDADPVDEAAQESLSRSAPGASEATPTSDSASGADEDAAFDLSDLEQKGVEGIVAGWDASEAPPARRPIWVSLVVLALAIPLLVRMYPDFRYWLQPSTPEDLGTAAEFVRDGEVPEGYNERHVRLRGTPDVRNVAVGKSSRETLRYMRLMESKGQLIAVVRTPVEQENKGETVRYPGLFEGRMTRLGDLGETSWLLWSEPDQYHWLSRFYEIENITRTLDASPEGLFAALQTAPGDALAIETEEGTIALGPSDRVRLVVEHPDSRVLLGKASFSAERAQEAMQALGVPFVAVESRDETRHRFVARIPAEARERMQRALAERAEPGANDAADPRQGVAVLPSSSTFLVDPAELALDGDVLRFPRGTNTSVAAYDVVDGMLRERPSEEEIVTVAREQLRAVRVEQAIRLDPDGYVILHGETPADRRMFALLWLFTAFVAFVNAGVVVVWGRRRPRKR